MREFIATINKNVLSLGLRTDIRDNRNSVRLEECTNLKATEDGLVPYEPILLPFSESTIEANNIELIWPFPQLLRGSGSTLLAGKYRLFEVNEEDWSLHLADVYDIDNESSEKSIPGGRLWSYSDFGKSLFLSNGECSIIHSNKDEMFGNAGKYLIDTNMKIESNLPYNGRLILGGFQPDYNFGTSWKQIWTNLADNSGISFDLSMDLKGNFIYYSCVGGGDIMALFSSSIAQTGYVTTSQGTSENAYDSAEPFIIDMFKRGDCGFMPLSFQGTVRKLLRFNNFIIAYGDDGVSALSPETVGNIHTFGETPMLPFGISGNGAACSGNKSNLMLSQDGSLWLLTDMSQGFQELGYKEYFESFVGTMPVITYDWLRNEYHISNNYESYVLTRNGLSKKDQIVTSIISAGGNSVGIATETEGQSEKAYVTLGGIDNGVPGIKLITTLHVGGDIYYTAQNKCIGYGAINYRHDRGDSFNSSTWKELNKEGTCTVIESGVEYKPKLKFTSYNSVKIDYINIGRKFVDNRHIRGLLENVE